VDGRAILRAIVGRLAAELKPTQAVHVTLRAVDEIRRSPVVGGALIEAGRYAPLEILLLRPPRPTISVL
jgi:hypothetical protein